MGQLCSLAQVLLDPFFRTLRGLSCLIEKDWIAFGHKFRERHGHLRGADDANNEQRSPVFLQFLDALHQIVWQFAERFEYTQSALTFIASHVTSCRYGTFLSDSERLRLRKHRWPQRTASLWSAPEFIDNAAHRNSEYRKGKDVLYVDHRAIKLRLWPFLTKTDAFSAHSHEAERAATAHRVSGAELNRNVLEMVASKRKDLEIKRLRAECEALRAQNEKLLHIEEQHKRVMKCIDTKNGFLLQDSMMPIMPDLDYVTVSASASASASASTTCSQNNATTTATTATTAKE